MQKSQKAAILVEEVYVNDAADLQFSYQSGQWLLKGRAAALLQSSLVLLHVLSITKEVKFPYLKAAIFIKLLFKM